MRKKAFTIAAAAALTLLLGSQARAQSYSNAVIALNPVAYWPLQENTAPPSGAYVASNLGTAGAAGNGYYQTWFQPWNTGTNTLYYQTNNIQHDAAGATSDGDKALQCTRSAAGSGGYVVFPRATNGVANSALTFQTPFSIELWVKPSSTTSAVMPIVNQGRIPTQGDASYGYAATNWTGFSIGQYGTIVFFTTYNGRGDNSTKEEIDVNITASVWQHLVITFNGTNATWFKNGVQTGTRTIPAGDANAFGQRYVPDPTSPLLIGTGSILGAGNGGSEFAGSIDEVAIYPRLLDATTITNHYAARTATDATYQNMVLAANPTIYVRLDEPAFPSSSYPSPSSYPVANNYGLIGAAGNGYYQPGTVPGVPGPALPGFGATSHAVAINGFSGAVDVGAGRLPAELNPTGAAPVSVVAWFQANPADAPARFQEIIGHGNNSWRLAMDATAAGARFNPGAGPELQFASSPDIVTNGFVVNDGKWHCAAGVSDGANDYLYLDGVLARSGTAVASIPGSASDALLGGDPDFLVPIWNGGSTSQPRYFDGQIAQVALFTNALSAAQIGQLYAIAAGPPTIQQQALTDVRVFAGSSPTLRVTASGAKPISYQWSLNGTPLAGATASAYTITNAQANGSYTCAVTNLVGPASPAFNAVSLTVLPDPTAPYPAAVLGSGPAAYFRLAENPDNGSGNTGTTAYDKAGGYNAVYNNVLLAQSGYNTVSEPGALAVEFGDYPPDNNSAGGVPSYLNFGTPNGGNAQFSVEAWIQEYLYLGGGNSIVALGYGNGGEQFVLDTGGTGGALRFFVRNAAGTASGASSSFIPASGGQWHHVVGVCDEAGGHVYLYLDGALAATGNIVAGSGLRSSTMPLTIGARESANNDPVSYDYQFIGKIDDVALYNRPLSAAEVQNHYLASGIAPVFTAISPANLTTNQGATVTFTATAVGTAPLSYQWYDPNNNPIGLNTNTLTLANVQTSQNGSYRVDVMNTYGSAETNAMLTVQLGAPQLQVDLEPTNVTAYAGDPLTFSVQVIGSLPLSYQWYRDGSAIASATDSSYTLAVLLGTNTYFVSVTNSYSSGAGGPVYSSTATVVGVQPPTVNPADFSAKLKLTFAGYNRGETLRDFPVLVKLGTNVAGFAYSQFASPAGGDLRFADATGTRALPYEIDQWNDSTGLSTVWVQVPRLSGTNDYIWAYWGNPGDTTPPDYATNGATWLPAAFEGLPPYQIVYHLKESALPFADGTLQHPATAGVAPSATAGIVGTGSSFGGSKWLDAGTTDVGDAFTLSAWVNIPLATSDIDGIWANKAGGYSVAGFALYVNTYKNSDQVIDLASGNGTAGNESTTAAGTVPFGSWHRVSAAVNRTNGTAQFYLDGDSAGSTSAVVKDFPTLNDLRLGQFVDGAFDFRGAMDEARIQSGVNSSNWVWASWATVAQNSSFASYSSVTSSVVKLDYQVSGNSLILSWPQGTLQSASPLNGGFTDLTGATSPYTNQMTGMQFFRVRVR